MAPDRPMRSDACARRALEVDRAGPPLGPRGPTDPRPLRLAVSLPWATSLGHPDPSPGARCMMPSHRRGNFPAGNLDAGDLRANMQTFGKTSPLTEAHFSVFEAAYGGDPSGSAARVDDGEAGRFRRFTRAEIEARGDNLDISWLRDTSADPEDTLTEPEEFVVAIRAHLTSALLEIEALADELDDGLPTEVAEAAEAA